MAKMDSLKDRVETRLGKKITETELEEAMHSLDKVDARIDAPDLIRVLVGAVQYLLLKEGSNSSRHAFNMLEQRLWEFENNSETQ
jgi:hypothetical protein